MTRTPPTSCAACGAPFEPGQEFCLECGSRIVAGPSPLRRLWERRLGTYPGDWLVTSALLLVVAGAGAAAAIAATSGSASDGSLIVATARVGRPNPSPVLPVTTGVSTTTPSPTATGPTRSNPTPPPPRPTLVRWPNRNAHTVVLLSVPTGAAGLTQAKALADDAISHGVPAVGILTSDTFTSLHPGYYVVFSGVYASLETAQKAAQGLSARYGNAYAREIAR